MKIILLVIILCVVSTIPSYATDIKEYTANAIEVGNADVTMLSHDSILLGMSCSSGPVGNIEGLSTIEIGDEITLENKSMKVGLIQVQEFLEDAKWGRLEIANKGDIICVVAENEEQLPSEDNCDALWLRIVNCKPM